MAEGKALYAALLAVQRDLKAPKGQTNRFGGYNYRSCEDILEAVKPLLNDNGLVLKLEDEPVVVDGWHYIKSTASVIDIATGDRESTTAYAQEPSSQKGMSQSQLTGTASSYARKYALNGLFCIDDTKDADTDEYTRQAPSTGAGARSHGNAYPSKGSTNDELRSKAMHSLSSEMKRVGASGAEVSSICGLKFGKTNSKDLSTGQLSELTAHLEEWVAERMGGE